MELEKVEQTLQLFGIRVDGQRIEIDFGHRRISTQQHQIEILTRTLLVLDE